MIPAECREFTLEAASVKGISPSLASWGAQLVKHPDITHLSITFMWAES